MTRTQLRLPQEDYRPIGWIECYIQSLKSVRCALSGNLSCLPEAIAQFNAAYGKVKFQEAGTAWSSLKDELYATVAALQDSVEDALNHVNSRFGACKGFERMDALLDCQRDANDAALLIRGANGVPLPKHPFQPSFCGRHAPPRPAPQPEIAHGKPAPEVIRQQAFVEVNEKLKKVVMQLTITLKIDNRTPITLQSPEMAFPIPPPNRGGRPIPPQDGTDAHSNFTQKRIGEIFHVSEGEVANWESGRRKPPFGYSADLRKRGDISEIMSIAETYVKDKALNRKIDARHRQRYVEGQTENEAGMVDEARHSHREGRY